MKTNPEPSPKTQNIFSMCLIIFFCLFLIPDVAKSQCPYDNTYKETWAAPTAVGDSVYTNCIYGGEFIRVTGIEAGEAYKISTCGNNNFWAQITIYPAGGGNFVAYSYYDECELVFMPTVSGDYDILIDEFYCEPANSLCMYLVVKKTDCPDIDAYIYSYPNPVCPNDLVAFIAFGEDSYSYEWDFGDGSPPSYFYNAYHMYSTPGTYNVSLKISNSCGNDSIWNYTINVVDNLPIDYAEMAIYPNPVCPNEIVEFYAYGNNSWLYLWDFGDESPVIQNKYTNHTYSSPGIYTVSLTITNTCGNDTTIFQTIDVVNNLQVPYIYMEIFPDYVCPGEMISFHAYPEDQYSYQWDFGDGSPNDYGRLTSHSYTSPGIYPVTLSITNGCGNSVYDTYPVYVVDNMPINYLFFYIDPNPVCPNDRVDFYTYSGDNSWSYQWDFGDGSPYSYGANTNYSYDAAGDYTVTLIATNGCGNSADATRSVQVVDNLPMTYGEAEIWPNNVCPNEMVYFWAYPSYHDYIWDFGDGSPASHEQYTSHSYSSLGTYPITLTITNGCGNEAIFTDIVTVADNIIPLPYNYEYLVLNNSVCSGDSILIIIYPGGNSYFFDFGDGNTSGNTSEFSPAVENELFVMDIAKHAYSEVGMYIISFTLINGCGNSFTDYFYVYVADNLPVYGEFWWYEEKPYVGNDIEFYAIGGISYQWDFGNGSDIITTFSSLSPVLHSYSEPGNYIVNVTISNACGNTQTYTDYIFIYGSSEVPEYKTSGNLVFSVYPNPNNGRFYIETENHEQVNLSLTIMNISGQIIYKSELYDKNDNVYEVDLSHYSRGIYFVILNSDEGFSVKKIILN